MSKLQVCDRCGVDVKDKTSGCVRAAKDVDEEHGGEYQIADDLCPRCWRAFRKMYEAWKASKVGNRFPKRR